MNLFGLSPGEIVLIMMIAMVVIGPEKIPETAASVGKWIREFRRVTTELTQQFTDENPFTEIQRAFSLTDLTSSLNSPLPGPAPVAAAPEVAVAIAEAPVVSATAVVGAIAAPVRSVYFDQPAVSVPVEDAWTHSGLDESYERHGVGQRLVFSDAIVDEWAHGVPLFDPPPIVVEPPIDEPAILELTADGEAIASDTPDAGPETASPELEYAVADHDASSVNGSTPVVEAHVDEPVAVGAAGSTGRS